MRGCRGARRRVVASTRPSPRWRRPGPGDRRTAAPPRGPRGRPRRGPSCRVAPARRRVGPRGLRRVASDPAASPTRATGSPSSRARSMRTVRVTIGELRRHRGPHGGRRCRHRVELEPGRHHLQVLVAGQRHGHEPVRAAEQPAAPPAARGPPSPQAHERGPLAQQRERVQSRERPGEPIDPFHQALRRSERLVGPSGERHGPAARPALHPGVVHVGRVTSRDPRTSERRSTARRTAQRDPSRANRRSPGRPARRVAGPR